MKIAIIKISIISDVQNQKQILHQAYPRLCDFGSNPSASVLKRR